MNATEIKKNMATAYALREPLFIMGPPGIGKSQLVREFCTESSLEMLDCRLIYWDTVDLRGMPHVDHEEESTRWLSPAIFPRKGKGVIFFDELPQAAPAVQAAASQFTLDRRLAEYEVPEGWAIFAAGNRQSDRAGSNKLQSQLVSRFCFVDMDVDLNAWSSWAIKVKLNPMVLAFIRFRVDLLYGFDAAKWDGKSYPCPRSWEKLARVVDHDQDASSEFLAGIVGHGPAVEFTAFRKLYQSLPPLDSILLSPKTAPVPKELSACWAVATGLARKATKGNMCRIITYLERMEREFCVTGIRDMIEIDKELCLTPDFVAWSTKNQDLLS